MARTLPHAQIVTGTEGENLSTYVEGILLPTDELIAVEEHPNLSKTSTGIYIDDIRDLQVAVRAGKKNVRTIVTLRDASKITIQAQNALLKLLEEPRKNLHFVLLTYFPDQLLATIRSRCQTTVHAAPVESIDIPAEHSARIKFMAGGQQAEVKKLVLDVRYFEQRSKLFEAAKKFVGGSRYDKLILAKEYGSSRDKTLEFIDASLQMYTALIKSNSSDKLVSEASLLLDVEIAVKQNANTKLQLLRLVV